MTATDDVKAHWMFTEYWGAPSDLPISDQENLEYGKALLMAANGDGQLTDAERDWIMGYLATGGHSEATLAELRNFDGQGDFKSLFTHGVQEMAQRVCIFDAIRAAGADGDLADGEIDAVRAMAAELEVPNEVVDQLVEIYREEQFVKARRVGLVFPNGFSPPPPPPPVPSETV